MNRAEETLYSSLTDTDALERLVTIGLDERCIPTEAMRPVVTWAIDRFFESGRSKAPSREALLSVWGEVLEEEEIELLDEDFDLDNIEWAIDNLKDLYVQRTSQQWFKQSATKMAEAGPTEPRTVFSTVVTEGLHLLNQIADRSSSAEALQGFNERLGAYEQRAAQGHTHMGMTFGLDPIDLWTYGIHPGELAILAAGPKTGKSYWLSRTALHEWTKRERNVVLFTLENSVEMTLDRMVCTYLGISPRAWMRGEVPEEKVTYVREFIHDVMPTMPGQLHVIMPPPGERTVGRMIRQAQLFGADSVLIDQLTFIEHPAPGRKARHEVVADIMRELKNTIASGRDLLPCLVAHQINREGMKAAAKQGFLEMPHLAESAEVERAADWVFGLYQSNEERKAQMAKFQVLAARREDLKNWQIAWRIDAGQARVLNEISLEAS